MQPFTRISGPAAPLIENDINTDQIAPGGGHRSLEPDYSELLFRSRRRDADGKPTGFILNRPQFRNAVILVTGANFGCGSSRETAVWAMAASGIRCIVAESFADIYRENCLKNGVLPVVLPEVEMRVLQEVVVLDDGAGIFTADLQAQAITAPDSRVFRFDIAPAEREILLGGLDDIGLTEIHLDEIRAWEARTARDRPWQQELKEARA